MKGSETDTGTKIDDVDLFSNETIDSLVTTVGLQRINPLEQLHRDMAHFDVRKIVWTIQNEKITDLNARLDDCLRHYRRSSGNPESDHGRLAGEN